LNNRAGHFLEEDISAFDAPFFSISPAEAHSMDPMQRILLEVVYEAMESAGIPASTFAGTDTSCFVGCFTSDYDQIAKRDPELLPKYHAIGTGQAILSNRISYCFDLKGPSVTLDTACSSSLVAVHLACQSLRMGESKTAIVGATHAILNPDVMIGMTNLHFLSPDSKCYTFDARANGYARGEGMAALVLKPLSDAIQDGDTIRAVIRGTAVNSNGKTTGITLPSRDAQVSLIRSAYRQAGCDPAVTGYCEAHGTGTAAGDPIEAGALGEALGAYRSDGEEGKLFVGSIKTNIGHLEGASGLAALVKTVMSLEKGVIAPNLWYEKGNPAIEFDAWRIRVPTEASPWPTAGLRRASVNGFGYGGTNGHVILDDAYHYMQKRGLNGKHQTCIPSGSDTNSLALWDIVTCTEHPRIFYLSAHEPASVLRNAKLLAAHLKSHQPDNDELFLDDLAFTLCERRSRHEIASTVIASSKHELIEGLESLTTTARRSFETPGLGFIFTGQGAQWWAMGRELMQFPVFAQSLATCEGAIESFGSSWSLLGKFFCGSSLWCFANDQLAHGVLCR
jgi:acyl transferase domain-containing protein